MTREDLHERHGEAVSEILYGIEGDEHTCEITDLNGTIYCYVSLDFVHWHLMESLEDREPNEF